MSGISRSIFPLTSPLPSHPDAPALDTGSDLLALAQNRAAKPVQNSSVLTTLWNNLPSIPNLMRSPQPIPVEASARYTVDESLTTPLLSEPNAPALDISRDLQSLAQNRNVKFALNSPMMTTVWNNLPSIPGLKRNAPPPPIGVSAWHAVNKPSADVAEVIASFLPVSERQKLSQLNSYWRASMDKHRRDNLWLARFENGVSRADQHRGLPGDVTAFLASLSSDRVRIDMCCAILSHQQYDRKENKFENEPLPQIIIYAINDFIQQLPDGPSSRLRYRFVFAALESGMGIPEIRQLLQARNTPPNRSDVFGITDYWHYHRHYKLQTRTVMNQNEQLMYGSYPYPGALEKLEASVRFIQEHASKDLPHINDSMKKAVEFSIYPSHRPHALNIIRRLENNVAVVGT